MENNLSIVKDQFKPLSFCYPLEGFGTVENNMSGVVFIIPVCKSFIIIWIKLGHDC